MFKVTHLVVAFFHRAEAALHQIATMWRQARIGERRFIFVLDMVFPPFNLCDDSLIIAPRKRVAHVENEAMRARQR